MRHLRNPGLWILCASLILIFMFQVAEFLYPGYSVSENYISDMGVGPEPTRTIFSVALIVFGVMVLMAAALLYERDRRSPFWLFVAIAGAGALGVAIFNENYPVVHFTFSAITFFFGNLAAVYSFRLTRVPFSWIAVVLGAVGLASMIPFGLGFDLGLGPGGMERIIFFCAILWAVCFGSYLLAAEAAARPQG